MHFDLDPSAHGTHSQTIQSIHFAIHLRQRKVLCVHLHRRMLSLPSRCQNCLRQDAKADWKESGFSMAATRPSVCVDPADSVLQRKAVQTRVIEKLYLEKRDTLTAECKSTRWNISTHSATSIPAKCLLLLDFDIRPPRSARTNAASSSRATYGRRWIRWKRENVFIDEHLRWTSSIFRSGHLRR